MYGQRKVGVSNLGKLTDVDITSLLPTEGDFLGYGSGKWKPVKPPSGSNVATGGASYLVELSRWGIKNDKTASTTTATGINNAFKWAYDNGYSSVVLPKGEYLIPPSISITPQNNTYYDFNGSKVYMETNNAQQYAVIKIGSSDSTKKAHHITIANGEFVGDRYTHDYSDTSGGNHEWGHCISLKGSCKFIRIENCIMRDGTGDGLTGEYNYDVWLYPTASNFEVGGINKTTGANVTASTTVRTITPYDVSHFRVTNNDGKFLLSGNGYSVLAGITTDVFDVYFYDANGAFLSVAENKTWYQDIDRPTGATKMHFVLHQATTANISFEVRAEPRPEFITVENCEIHHNRRLGIACTGMRYFYIMNNELHHNTGYVGGGIDIEDGYRSNQNIYIIGNKFYGHGVNDVIVVGTYYVTIANNSFNSNCGGSGRYWNIIGNYFQRAGGSITASDVIFSNNSVHDAIVQLGLTTVGKAENISITDCVFRNARLSVIQSSPYTVSIENCKFANDSNRYITGASIDVQNNPMIIRNISVFGGDALATYSLDVTVENSTFVNILNLSQWVKYKNCTIINPTSSSAPSGSNKLLSFDRCKIVSNIRLFTFNNTDSSLEFKDCEFTTSASSAETIYITNAKKLNLINCKVDLSASTTGFFVSGGGTNKAYIVMKNNEFIGTTTNVKPYDSTWKLPVEPVVFSGNTLDGIGTITRIAGDTFDDGTTAQRPRKRLLLGMRYFDTTLGKPIYVKSIGTSSVYCADVSVRSTAYKLGQLVLESGKVFECTTAGTTGASAPTWSITTASTTVDGTITWTCKGDSAVWADATGVIV
ncbi:right-handed parallel beta-helix repeat-containing protein [Priestia aryabhattai]|uniref:right-handed parallel beta-helix repeat-containing protein n=1 Tax=Priestia aryabhattai TaxID=412384 RepID=UPI0015F53CBC|nr:right-handed parallel beta-helix repeat-containing protein [Priestia aryabhattai]